MGLLDVLNGMQNGPRGARDPNAGSSGGGMSPITMALIGLLAYKALKSFSASSGSSAPAPAPAGQGQPAGGGFGDIIKNALDGLAPGQGGAAAPGQGAGSASGGGLGDILSGGLGGLLGGSAAGGVLTNGLGDLIRQFEQSGHGEVARSWVDHGPNQPISPNDLEKALGADQIDTLSAHTGLSREDLLAGLSRHLPDAVDHLTPEGRLPTEDELSRAI
jgi:uncharacterized protein YidB (DUF937 family)